MKRIVLLIAVLFSVWLTEAYASQGDDLLTSETIGFATVGGLLLLVSSITEGIKKVVELKTFWYQVISWVVSIALSFAGWYFKLGIFESIQLWYIALLIGIGLALMSNGFYDIGRIILKYFGINTGKPLSVKDNSNYFKNNSKNGVGEFRFLYNNGTAAIHPLRGGETLDLDIK